MWLWHGLGEYTLLMNASSGTAANAADEHLVLHERARRLLIAGDAQAAHDLLQQVVAMSPRHVPYWLSLAAALRVLGRREEEFDTLERALAIDPAHLVVLLQKATVLDLMNKPRAAAAVYGYALQTLTTGLRVSPSIEAHVRHAQKRVAENAAQLSALLAGKLETVQRDSTRTGGSRARFDRCLDRVLGRRRIYMPEPTFMLFPHLSNYEFYGREAFPWLQALEAQTESIREELLGILNEDQAGIRPYIAFADGLPLKQWRELNHSRRWSAYFLWNQGKSEHAHLARCPRTAAALATVPQVDVPGRGPTAFFSILEARTTIPPHNGATNTRLTVHLPLIVPDGCRFRVGGETREWKVGEAWIFDDTIEHEAWNNSEAPRAILIFDIWHPELTPLERDLIRETTTTLAQYYEVEGHVPGVVF